MMFCFLINCTDHSISAWWWIGWGYVGAPVLNWCSIIIARGSIEWRTWCHLWWNHVMGTICGPNNCHGPRYPSEVVTLPSLSPDDEFGSFLSEHPASSIEFFCNISSGWDCEVSGMLENLYRCTMRIHCLRYSVQNQFNFYLIDEQTCSLGVSYHLHCLLGLLLQWSVN